MELSQLHCIKSWLATMGVVRNQVRGRQIKDKKVAEASDILYFIGGVQKKFGAYFFSSGYKNVQYWKISKILAQSPLFSPFPPVFFFKFWGWGYCPDNSGEGGLVTPLLNTPLHSNKLLLNRFIVHNGFPKCFQLEGCYYAKIFRDYAFCIN